MLRLGIGGHGDCLTKYFGGHKRCSDGHWPLTGSYFKRCLKVTKFLGKIYQFEFLIISTSDLQEEIAAWKHC